MSAEGGRWSRVKRVRSCVYDRSTGAKNVGGQEAQEPVRVVVAAAESADRRGGVRAESLVLSYSALHMERRLIQTSKRGVSVCSLRTETGESRTLNQRESTNTIFLILLAARNVVLTKRKTHKFVRGDNTHASNSSSRSDNFARVGAGATCVLFFGARTVRRRPSRCSAARPAHKMTPPPMHVRLSGQAPKNAACSNVAQRRSVYRNGAPKAAFPLRIMTTASTLAVSRLPAVATRSQTSNAEGLT